MTLQRPILRDDRPVRSTGWRESWIGFRNRLLASPRFQRWAARFPLTRPITRRRVRSLFDLVAGFVYSQVLSACVSANLFDLLSQRPQSLSQLAPQLGLDEASALTLLKAAISLELVQSLPDGRFVLGPLGAALCGNPSVLAMIQHHAMLYDDLRDPLALLRGELSQPKLAAFWAYAGTNDPASAGHERVAAYSSLMAQSQALVASEILDAYPLDRHRSLLDIGGGEGVFLTHAGRRASGLSLTLFDLPSVAARARIRLQEAGLGERSQCVGGSFLQDDLPIGADIASLVRVLHDHDDDAAMIILRRARAALAPGGVLLVAEPMAGTRNAKPAGDAYFGLYLTAMGSGRPRTAEEIRSMLSKAGFHSSRLVPTHTPLIVRLIVAVA